MSEFEKYDIISIAEGNKAIEIADQYLPVTGEEIVGDDSSLHKARTAEFSYATPEATHFTVVSRDFNEYATGLLVAIKVIEHNTGVVDSTKYTFVTNNGRFFVQRQTEQAADILDEAEGDINPHAEIERDTIEFELGLLKPVSNDWDDFIDLLTHPAGPPETIAQPGRLMRAFGWLKRDKQRL